MKNVLLHLPRTSGTSLTHALNIENTMHQNAAQLSNMLDENFIFTVNRNVYRRLFSLYNYFDTKRKNYVKEKLYSKYKVCSCNNLDKLYSLYIDKRINYNELKYSLVFNNHFETFSSLLTYLQNYKSINEQIGIFYLYDHVDFISLDGKVVAEKIFDFYNQNEIKNFFKLNDMPHHNSTGSDIHFASDIYSTEDKKIVNNLFAKEIEYFKYELK
jgi:hypothetical protein